MQRKMSAPHRAKPKELYTCTRYSMRTIRIIVVEAFPCKIVEQNAPATFRMVVMLSLVMDSAHVVFPVVELNTHALAKPWLRL